MSGCDYKQKRFTTSGHCGNAGNDKQLGEGTAPLLASSARSQIYNITLYIRRPAVVLFFSFLPFVPLLFSPLSPLIGSLSLRWLRVRNATQWWLGIGPRGDRQSQQQSREKMGKRERPGKKENEGAEKKESYDRRALNKRIISLVALLIYLCSCILYFLKTVISMQQEARKTWLFIKNLRKKKII